MRRLFLAFRRTKVLGTENSRTKRRLFRILVFGIVFELFILSCHKSEILDPEDQVIQPEVVIKLNQNVEGFRNLAEASAEVDSIAIFNVEYNDDGSVLYWLSMKEGEDIELYSEIVSQEVLVPELSMSWIENGFYWMINGSFLTDSEGNRIPVTDQTKSISFFMRDEVIYCNLKNDVIGEYPVTRTEYDYYTKDVLFVFDPETCEYNVSLSSGDKITLPMMSGYKLLEGKRLSQSYYKDVFLDGGISLTTLKTLSAARYLNLSLEGVTFPSSIATFEKKTIQKAIISGDSNDSNGRLLYPDGQPRYKLLFVLGGDSKAHGQSLEKSGLENMRRFVQGGGCYVGTCAGAFLASNGYDGRTDYQHYLSIYPGMMSHSGLVGVYHGVLIEKDSPLFRFDSFGGDSRIDSVYHNYGGYPVDLPEKTEVLARISYPKRKSAHLQPSVWAYKDSQYSGRIVLCGSHPEAVSKGENRDLLAAMLMYALDGRGVASLKGFLKNGVKRLMDKKTEDMNPAFTRIGDLQTHHFAAYIPPNAKKIRVEVSSPSDCDLALMMSQQTYSFPDEAEYYSSVPGAHQSLSFQTIKEGFWFIGVKCLSTVTVKETDYGQEYSGKTEVLNGVPYTISISWE